MEGLTNKLVVQVGYKDDKGNSKIPPQWIDHINGMYKWGKYLLINLNSEGTKTTIQTISEGHSDTLTEEGLNLYQKNINNAVIIGHGGDTNSPYFGLSLTSAGKLLSTLNKLLCSLLSTEEVEHNLRLQVCHAASPNITDNLATKISKAVPSNWMISAPKYYSFITKDTVVDLPEKIGEYRVGNHPNPMQGLNEIVKNGGLGTEAEASDTRKGLYNAIVTANLFSKTSSREDRIQSIQDYSKQHNPTVIMKGSRLELHQ
ncbi:MAG: hypothetical protein RMY62_016305 [Nostoc sp. ZfuVER08]|nr:hypothetical protein [Nostoc sp. ZfuVER08]